MKNDEGSSRNNNSPPGETQHELTPHQLSALNYSQHISLTANAGSGKTLVLSRRFVEIALRENLPLRNIAAITFTEKAAGELYNKISREIESRSHDSNTTASEKKQLERIRRELLSASISTIHSFCIDILRSFPVESGLDAGFTPMDQFTADELLRLSTDSVIRSSFIQDSAGSDVRYLMRIFSSRAALSDAVVSLVQKRKILYQLADEIYSGTVAKVSQKLHGIFEKRFAEMYAAEAPELFKSLRAVNEYVLAGSHKSDHTQMSTAEDVAILIDRLTRAADTEEILSILSELKNRIITSSGTLRRSGYLKQGSDQLSGETAVIESFFDSGIWDIKPGSSTGAENDLARFGKILLRVTFQVISQYTARKTARGYVDFEDILLYTRDILSRPEIRKRLNERYRYIMIDEYQDTNEIQYEIFMPIVNYLRDGNLFVVGDEKQSIYMFRDAEPEVFEKTKLEISGASGAESLLSLPDSFRMSPRICAFTNHLFSGLFRSTRSIYDSGSADSSGPAFTEAVYSPLICASGTGEDEGVIEILLSGRNELPEQGNEAETNQAALVAEKIMELISATGMTYDNIAVLCRKRKSFRLLEKAFGKYNIPYTIIGEKDFFRRQIVYDTGNYLSFLINHGYDAALIGTLRSPFFMLSDASLFDISLEDGISFWDKMQKYSWRDSGEYEKIREAVVRLEAQTDFVRSGGSITAIVRRIFRDSKYISTLASGANASQELSSYERIISAARKFSQTGIRTLYDFIRYLHTVANSAAEETAAVPVLNNNSVKIMTIHQAKGLEYEAVFLYSCEEYSAAPSVRSGSVIADKHLGLLASLPDGDNYFEDFRQAPSAHLFNFISRRKQADEIKRLMYVAVTRAKKYLFLSAVHRNFRFNRASFMGLFLDGLGYNQGDDIPESIHIDTLLGFLLKKENKYINESRKISFDIPLKQAWVKELNEDKAAKTSGVPDEQPFHIHTEPVTDSTRNEIFTADEFNSYMVCPNEYRLKYELGGLRLAEKLRLESKTAVHDLSAYYSSDIYKIIRGYDNAQTNPVIYIAEDGYFLHGVPERVAYSGDLPVIIGYIFDDIEQYGVSITDRYVWKFRFWAYLLYRSMESAPDNIGIWMVHTGDPGKSIYFINSRREMLQTGEEIARVLRNIRGGIFPEHEHNSERCEIRKIFHNFAN